MLFCMNRRTFLNTAAASGLLSVLPHPARGSDMSSEIVEYQKPVFDLHRFFSDSRKNCFH